MMKKGDRKEDVHTVSGERKAEPGALEKGSIGYSLAPSLLKHFTRDIASHKERKTGGEVFFRETYPTSHIEDNPRSTHAPFR